MIVIKVAIMVPSLMTGGAENMAAQLAAHISRDKFCVELLVLDPPRATVISETVEQAGVKVVYFNKKAGFSSGALYRIFRHLDKFKPNVIHTHLGACLYAMPWAVLNGVKIIHTIHSRPGYELKHAVRKVLGLLYKRNIAIPVAISDIMAKEVMEYYGLPAGWVETIYNPVDIFRYSRLTVRRANPGGIVFVNVARFVPGKNQMGLIEAFNCARGEIPQARLILVGDGALKDRVEARVKQLGLDSAVDFTGDVSDVPQRLAGADIFVLPSEHEGLPMTILEAMAAGLPVIATAVGGVPDIVRDNGILINKGDIGGLAGAMIKLAKDEESRRTMGECARTRAQKYNITGVASQYERLYRRCGGS